MFEMKFDLRSVMADPHFAYGLGRALAARTGSVHGGDGDPDQDRLWRVYSRLARGKASPAAGRLYAPGEAILYQRFGLFWGRHLLERFELERRGFEIDRVLEG